MKRKNRNARPPAFSATHKGGRKGGLGYSYCMEASAGLTRSTLFCNMIILARRIISTAAKCSEVWGWGQASLPAMRRRAASMTAAPLSMVAI